MARSLIPNQFDYAGIYVEGKRSQFNFKKPHKASFMAGMLVPMGDPISVFPGVKLDLQLHAVVRSNTMVAVPLNPIYIDFFSVWVPHRIVWNHMPQFLGENDTTAWTQALSLTYPSLDSDYLLNGAFSLFDALISGSDISVILGNNFLTTHYGLVSREQVISTDAVYGKKVSVLAFRGYYSLWNHFFRDENYQRPVLFDKGDSGAAGEYGYLVRDYFIGDDGESRIRLSTQLGVNVSASTSDSSLRCFPLLMPVNKFHDWAFSVLPQPQFGNPVEFSMADKAEVIIPSDPVGQLAAGSTLTFKNITALPAAAGSYSGLKTSSSVYATQHVYADLSTATALSVAELRSAVMYQRYLEALARGGRRVVEYYEVVYGVKNSKAQDDYPEMISHTRYQLGVNQVVATADGSSGNWSSHLGDTGAYSVSSFRNVPVCEKDFTEFGYLHILYAIRCPNDYSQALPQHFFRSTLLDEYNPYFDHIGDVDIPNYLVNKNAASIGNWGYQEAWWFERDQVGLTVGALNKEYGSLRYWVIGDRYDSTDVTCTPSLLCFDPGVFDDVFVSTYFTYPQFIIDAVIFGTKAGRMSLHSIPGIVGRI